MLRERIWDELMKKEKQWAFNNCHIFQEQMAGVLDAMFEKTVQAGEFIIRQGDDGDNFYVIEKYAFFLFAVLFRFFFYIG